MGVMADATKICVILPPPMTALTDIDRLRTTPGLDVHHIAYRDPPHVRSARQQRRLTPEIAADCGQLSAEDAAALAQAEAVIALDLPLDLGARAPRLTWVQAVGAGIEQLDPPGLANLGITLTNASGVAAAPIAEYVMAQLLAIWKNVRTFDAQQRDRIWEKQPSTLVAGKTLGVVGFGAIGRATAVRARAFDIQVLATSRSATPGAKDSDADELIPLDRLDDLLGRSDAVLASMPATPRTIRYFDAAKFAMFKPGSIFCNISRGTIVDEQALLAALDLGRPGHAVLDVTFTEPTPPDDPLWAHSAVHLTPHSSTSREGYGTRLVDLFLDNLDRRRTGRPLRNVVDPSLGY